MEERNIFSNLWHLTHILIQPCYILLSLTLTGVPWNTNWLKPCANSSAWRIFLSLNTSIRFNLIYLTSLNQVELKSFNLFICVSFIFLHLLQISRRLSSNFRELLYSVGKHVKKVIQSTKRAWNECNKLAQVFTRNEKQRKLSLNSTDSPQ